MSRYSELVEIGIDPIFADMVCMAEDEGEWITIGGGPGEGGEKHKGGFPVLVKDGTIVGGGGPASIKGLKISEVKGQFDKINSSSKSGETAGPAEPPPPRKVGDKLAEVQSRINEVKGREHSVTHEKGYYNSSGATSYLAEINGTDPKYGLSRDFMESGNIDWKNYNYKKGKGTFEKIHDIPNSGGVYEEQEQGSRNGYIYYPAIGDDGKATLANVKIGADTLSNVVRNVSKAGLSVADIPKALSDSHDMRVKDPKNKQPDEMTVTDRVQRWIDAKK